jgi:hypothetical protein
MECQFPTTETRIKPVSAHRGVGSPSWWPAAGEHPATETYQHVSEKQTEGLDRAEKISLHIVRLGQILLEFDHTIYFWTLPPLLCSAQKQIRSNCRKNQLETRSESIKRNAWSLIVNYQGEPVTTDMVVQGNDFSLKAPISLFQIGSARPAWWWRRWLADNVAAANISDAFQYDWRFNYGNEYVFFFTNEKENSLIKCFGSRAVCWSIWCFIQMW